MLKAAGVENLKTDIWWMPVQRPYNPNAKRMAEMMQADLAKVGIEADPGLLRVGRIPQAHAGGRAPDGPARLDGDNGDPDNFLAVLLGCNAEGKPNANNIPKWCNARFQEVVNKAAEISDKDERTKLYVEAQQIVAAEVPWLNIAHSTVFEPVRKEVQGYKISPFGSHEFQNVDIAE